MPDDPRVQQLLDELLDSDATPEEVCASCPELLPVVRDRWQQMRCAQAELDALFPPAPEPGQSLPALPLRSASDLPVIPGYEVESVLGRGGMGVVFRARHVSLNRPVALKMVLAGAYAGPAERECLRREAETIAALRHPHIVPVYDVGEVDSRPYFTMELVEGGSLAQRLTGAPLPAKQAAALVTTVADAIESAHRAGIVHRDLKPANILLSADGTPKVADFSLARRIEGVTLTQSGVAVGTPSYMSPEQASGRSRDVGPATDVYALGAILYELLTGRPPFRAETSTETVLQVVSQEAVPPARLNASVPRDLETVCLKCLEKSPSHRFPTAAALADDLRRFQRGEPVSARPIGRPGRIVRWARRNPAAAGLVVAAALLIILGGVLGVRERERVVRQRAEIARWEDRLTLVTQLQQDGRFAEARATLSEAHTDAPDLDRQITDARARLDLVEYLDAIRLSRDRDPKGSGLDYAASSRRYAEVFRSVGLAEVGEDSDLVVGRLASSPVRKALIAALDDWAACAEKKDRDWVLGLTRRLDPDPWRDRVRDPDAWANTAGFPALAAAADVPRQPVTLMVAFGTRWRRLGGDPTAFLERVQRQYPTDFWVNFELGHLLAGRDVMAAVGYLRGALAVRPEAAVVHFHLGDYFALLGRPDDAIHHYQRGLVADPGVVRSRNDLGVLLRDRGLLNEAITHWQKSLEFEPKQPAVRRAIRGAQARIGRLEEARDEWQKFLAGGTDAHGDWDGYAELCLYFGREEEYRRTRRELLDRFESNPDLQIAERTVRACLLAPLAPGELRRVSAVVDRTMSGDWKPLPAWVPPYFWFMKGLAEYRQNQLENAISIMRGKTADVLGPAPRLISAMAEHRLGRKDEARKSLASAIRSFDWEPSKADSREAWMYHVLRREAERVIATE
ncbi:serine threonine protein kinase : Tetratricopeptide repeat protein,protein kinase family protein OS=Singulisphaera acidiphila (strain ATCC BAA-1392 / DSM 18658 / VKM B-2454 / MOB10) GN=Sinac_4434 PE=3 SV=1: Pkinase: TPR_2: TPR_1 [Gemmata massiliana]|uniref:non-specific serine/threonine protein kinase n=1 Tax=Gemmata massiliana TaxID=1210884 RepID=A0A6P2D1L7_9BACT|nr:serine/threonine-protein kinase [Gemmata massiliana]VTR94004.1 serine threonine protein kinase : Tetratricopeptide repeat protein,protein kinase family protein OS=Singulisphaera acidiphila (strain ATCC BAA-1392 / DSM 18658 / VKM B-2454 / MOB10) GN=Sinac_4434 PE=3 SV=1: Pkinase: TPR_2: TPR_1 [Gemmata massiliana]